MKDCHSLNTNQPSSFRVMLSPISHKDEKTLKYFECQCHLVYHLRQSICLLDVYIRQKINQRDGKNNSLRAFQKKNISKYAALKIFSCLFF